MSRLTNIRNIFQDQIFLFETKDLHESKPLKFQLSPIEKVCQRIKKKKK